MSCRKDYDQTKERKERQAVGTKAGKQTGFLKEGRQACRRAQETPSPTYTFCALFLLLSSSSYVLPLSHLCARSLSRLPSLAMFLRQAVSTIFRALKFLTNSAGRWTLRVAR